MTDQNINLDELDHSWTDYFRYDTVYKDQVTGINNFLDALKENGFHTLEGPCGTGKTLIGTTAVLHAMRSGAYPTYEEACILTPAKQQLKQFIEEMRGVNRSLDSDKNPAKTVVMKGKTDMVTYAYTDIAPFNTGSFNTTLDRIRRMSRKVMSFGSDIPIDWPGHISPPASAKYDFDWDSATEQQEKRRKENRYDPIRAKAVCHILRQKAEHSPDHEKLTLNGVETPYPDVIPHTRHIVDSDEMQATGMDQLPMALQGKFDPFYVGFFAEGSLTFGFNDAEDHVFDKEELYTLAASNGVCPHEAMSHFGKKADIILGNYMHFFDPQTRNLTVEKMNLFTEKTITIFDEAHEIEGKVREMLSDTLDIYTIDKVIADLEYAEAYFENKFSKTPTNNPNTDTIETINEIKNEAAQEPVSINVDAKNISETISLFNFLKQKLTELSADHLNENVNPSWMAAVENNDIDNEEFPLSSPDFPDAEDKLLRKVTSRFDNGVRRMKNAYAVLQTTEEFYNLLESEGIHTREPQEAAIGRFCLDWVTKDGLNYHREVVLEKSPKENIDSEYPRWIEGWTPKFQLYNCIPTEELKRTFSTIGGGLLMSATLSPPDVYQEVVGVNEIPVETDDEDDEESTQTTNEVRHSTSDEFPLRFPDKNRESIIADLPRYTSSKRGKLTQSPAEMNDTRRMYAEAIIDVLNTQGNIMVCMPNYNEAQWIYKFTKSQTEKECYLDQSSSNDETTETLAEFFAGDNNAIFTSARGTITEGVDYDGDKLHCCVVVGIPLVNTEGKRWNAVEHAYGQRIASDKGYNTAVKIPAVRKSRQAIGRVIRGENECGVRILMDGRYAKTDWSGVNQYLSKQEQDEFDLIPADDIKTRITNFWRSNGK